MTQRYDLVIAGGGPSGSAAAWQAAQTGAKVVVLDKAEFPRDKPCGDGLTARAVSYLQKMGLAERGRRLPQGEPGDGVQPEPVGAVVPEAPRHARPRPHGQPHRARHASAQARRIGRRRGAAVRRGDRPRARRQRPGHRGDPEERREGVRRCGHRRRRRLLPDQASAEDRLGVQRLLGDRDPLGDARQPTGLRQPRHLPQAGVPGRPAAGLRLGVPDGRRTVQHRAGLRQQLQELAVDQRHPVPRRVPADAARASGSCRRSRN